jgi:hypothetical protein
MRPDMFEVIIERPRGGAGREKGNRRGERTERAFERAPKREGMGMGRGTKWLNENLAPLRRFLRRRTGKPWSRVSSEMSAVLSMRSAVQKHVMDHVRQYVEEDVVLVDGKPHYSHSRHGRSGPLECHPRWPRFYVCPRTGLLREAPHLRPRQSTVDAAAGLGQ